MTQKVKQLLSRYSKWLFRTGLVALILGIAVAMALLSFILTHGWILRAPSAAAQSGPNIEQVQKTPLLDDLGTPLPDLPQENPNAPASEAQLQPWDGVGRVTVLVMGLDYRDWESGKGASRSDTMILLTLDPLNKTAGMLSVPRDLWVSIPGFKHGKINTAHYLGDAYKLPGGGPGLAVKTVEQFLGVPINYYAIIDFNAFIRFIDEIGGVKIDVPEKIKIDPLGDNNTKTLKPGVQTLPGELALAYARARYTEGGDFDRAKRQQQVILGIRNRIISFDMLPTLVQKAPTLYQELSSGVHTNLKLDEAIRLALLAQQVADGNIKQGVISQKQVIFGRSPDNLSILMPIPDKIQTLRDEIFAVSGSLGALTPGNAQQQMQAEGAKIGVYNGSRVDGLAERSADYLQTQGASISQVGGAGQRYGATRVVDYTGNPYTVKYLVELFEISPNQIYLEYDPNSAIGVEIYLGYDAENLDLP